MAEIAIVGVGVGTIEVLGVGRKREARTPMRTPKRIKAMTMKNVLRKPDGLDDEGVVWIWGDGDGRGDVGCNCGEIGAGVGNADCGVGAVGHDT